MQKPMTPIFPVQASWPASHMRAASMSSNVLPLRALMSRMIVRWHRSREPQ